MPAPIVVAALKYLAGKQLEKAGLPSGLVDPKGYVIGKIAEGVDEQTGMPAGSASAMIDPVGTAKREAKKYVVQKVMDKVTESMADEPPEAEEPVAKARGGLIKTASRRGDGIAQRGKTKGRMR
jgi:hypothetical protein